jgi:hypothetical protein
MKKRPDVLEISPTVLRRSVDAEQQHNDQDPECLRQFEVEARRRMAEPVEDVDLEAELAAICAELNAPTDRGPKR